jgi:hypothetical protein
MWHILLNNIEIDQKAMKNLQHHYELISLSENSSENQYSE